MTKVIILKLLQNIKKRNVVSNSISNLGQVQKIFIFEWNVEFFNSRPKVSSSCSP